MISFPCGFIAGNCRRWFPNSGSSVVGKSNSMCIYTVSSRWCLENLAGECLQTHVAGHGLPPLREHLNLALLRGSFGVFFVGGGFFCNMWQCKKAAGVLCTGCRGHAANLTWDAGSGVYIYMYTYIHAYDLIRWTTLRLFEGKKQRER